MRIFVANIIKKNTIMGFTIKEVKVSESRKRVDAKIEYSSFWNTEYTADFRIISRSEIPNGKEENLLREIHDNKEKWKEGKENKVYTFEQVNATGYIIDYSPQNTGIV